MKPVAEMSALELSAWVCDALYRQGIEVVLSGGACVMIYAENKYMSYDIDLIDCYITPRKKLRSVMESLGFSEHHRYFVHNESPYLIEFPAGPLGIGDENITDVYAIDTPLGQLRLLSPTDCVKDRLAFYHWGDLQSLEQALLVAMAKEIDLENVHYWSAREGCSEQYIQFTNELKRRQQ